ncbi:MAG: hypothetical protein ACOC6F_01450 [bacterium]
MPREIADDLIEIDDPEIDVDQIMDEIRDRIQRRREEMGYPRQTFPSFGAAAYPGEPEHERFDEDLYYPLRKANDLYMNLGVEVVLSPSLATRVPILGRLWKQIRREAHNLVLFYLSRLAGRQTTVNRHLVSTLNRMAVQLQQQSEEVRELRQELGRLQGKADGLSE